MNAKKLTRREQAALVRAATRITQRRGSPFSCQAVSVADRYNGLATVYGTGTGANELMWGTHQNKFDAIAAVNFETQLARTLCILLFKEANS